MDSQCLEDDLVRGNKAKLSGVYAATLVCRLYGGNADAAQGTTTESLLSYSSVFQSKTY